MRIVRYHKKKCVYNNSTQKYENTVLEEYEPSEFYFGVDNRMEQRFIGKRFNTDDPRSKELHLLITEADIPKLEGYIAFIKSCKEEREHKRVTSFVKSSTEKD